MTFKQLLSLIFFYSVLQSGYSQNFLIQAKSTDSKYWGYINLKGEFAIPPKFDIVYEFDEDGHAVVLDKKSLQFEIIDAKGAKVKMDIPKFKLKEYFGYTFQGIRDGMLMIQVDDMWGYLNSDGKAIVKPNYDRATAFNRGYAAVQVQKRNFILDRNGKTTEVANADVILVKGFSEGLAPFEHKNGLVGFLDEKGEIVIEARFQSVGYFISDLAWAKLPTGQIGYINRIGEWVIQPKFIVTKDFDAKSGMARVKKDSHWQYVDREGTLLRINDIETFKDFSDGLCIGEKNGKFGAYDNKGNWVVEPKFQHIRDFKNGYAAAKFDKRWGIIDKSGNWILNPTFDDIKEIVAIK